MNPYDVQHLLEHFVGGVRTLAARDTPLRERLIPVLGQCLTQFGNPDGLDPLLRPIWRAVRNACNTHHDAERGSVFASINAMENDDLEWLVSAFIDIANWVERNIPEDLAHAIIGERPIPMHFRDN